jgi:hypothetical protein
MAAARFGARPSALIGLRDPLLALDFDLAAVTRLLEAERASLAASSAALQPGESPSEGERGEGALRAREEHW